MLIKRLSLLLLILSLAGVFAPAQVTQGPQTLISGKPIEREIAGGETDPYQIKLAIPTRTMTQYAPSFIKRKHD
jgi:hypothetical protein